MADSTTVEWLSKAIDKATRSASFCVAGCLPVVDTLVPEAVRLGPFATVVLAGLRPPKARIGDRQTAGAASRLGSPGGPVLSMRVLCRAQGLSGRSRERGRTHCGARGQAPASGRHHRGGSAADQPDKVGGCRHEPREPIIEQYTETLLLWPRFPDCIARRSTAIPTLLLSGFLIVRHYANLASS